MVFCYCGTEYEFNVKFSTKSLMVGDNFDSYNCSKDYECSIESKNCENPKLFLVVFDFLYKYYKTMYQVQDRVITPQMLREEYVHKIKYLTKFQRAMWLEMYVKYYDMNDIM